MGKPTTKLLQQCILDHHNLYNLVFLLPGSKYHFVKSTELAVIVQCHRLLLLISVQPFTVSCNTWLPDFYQIFKTGDTFYIGKEGYFLNISVSF